MENYCVGKFRNPNNCHEFIESRIRDDGKLEYKKYFIDSYDLEPKEEPKWRIISEESLKDMITTFDDIPWIIISTKNKL